MKINQFVNSSRYDAEDLMQAYNISSIRQKNNFSQLDDNSRSFYHKRRLSEGLVPPNKAKIEKVKKKQRTQEIKMPS